MHKRNSEEYAVSVSSVPGGKSKAVTLSYDDGVREDHPFAGEASVDIARLRGEAIITYNRSTTLYNAFLQRCQEQDFVPHIDYQSMMPNFILDTIAFGSCVGVLPGPMLQLCHSQKLVSVPLAPDFPWEIALITRKDRYLSFAAGGFLEFAQAYFASV